MELPVPLQEWSVSNPHNNYKFTTMEKGDIKAIGATGLKAMTITSEFPNQDYKYLVATREDPYTCTARIEKWRLSGKPIRVVIPGTDINILMAIENFNYGKAEGDGSGDVVFVLELEEKRIENTDSSQTAKEVDGTSGLTRRIPEALAKAPLTHTVKKGEDLQELSVKYLGDGKRWKEIADANNIKDGWNLKEDTVLSIPLK